MQWVYAIRYQEAEGQVQAIAEAAPEAMAFGETVAEARAQMREGLKAAVRGRIEFGLDLVPPPELSTQDAREQIGLPADLAAKATVYAA